MTTRSTQTSGNLSVKLATVSSSNTSARCRAVAGALGLPFRSDHVVTATSPTFLLAASSKAIPTARALQREPSTPTRTGTWDDGGIVAAAAGMTATGQSACLIRPTPTDPNNTRSNGSKPRAPMTSNCAAADRAAKAATGDGKSRNVSTSTSAGTPSNSLTTLRPWPRTNSPISRNALISNSKEPIKGMAWTGTPMACTRCSGALRRAAIAAPQRMAASDVGEPSTPTTTGRRTVTDWGLSKRDRTRGRQSSYIGGCLARHYRGSLSDWFPRCGVPLSRNL